MIIASLKKMSWNDPDHIDKYFVFPINGKRNLKWNAVNKIK